VENGVLYRFVDASYRPHYEELVGSGLLASLVESGQIVSHEEVPARNGSWKVLKPERVPFVSYPYEWCFGQLKDAALLTLDIQTRAMDRGMRLKDASAYNVQFIGARPVFIDTLSFESTRAGEPWVAYQQFCRHFLAPLALMSRTDIRLGDLLRVHVDGPPLDLASRLLSRASWFSFGLLTHIHLHARSQAAHGSGGTAVRAPRVKETGVRALVDSLRRAVAKLDWKPMGTEWADYYEETNYTDQATARKMELVRSLLGTVRGAVVWDLGANTGLYSRVAADAGAQVLAFDLDPAAVERNYRACKDEGEERILPLVMNLANPSPASGWAHTERDSLETRGPADVGLGLALIHHLAIGNNVPLERIAAFLAGISRALVIEWVPKEDSQVQRMLSNRADVFDEYSEEGFEAAFGTHFELARKEPIPETARILYRMEPTTR
jgi:ribosomal protein L11 methylase PrmA